jgi:ABC-type transporter Mla subunit MlaD
MTFTPESKARILFATVLLLAVAIAAAWYLASESRYTLYELDTDQPVSGLVADAPVEYHGVEVGSVKSVRLVDSRSVRVLLEVRNEAPITAATVATITPRGLSPRGFTGYVYVALEDAGSDHGLVPIKSGQSYPTIPVIASKAVSLDVAVNQVTGEVQELTNLMHGALDPKTLASFRQALENLQQLSEALANTGAKLGPLIANADQATRQLQPVLQASNATLTTLQNDILPETHRALVGLDTASSALVAKSDLLSRRLDPLLDSSSDAVRALQWQVLPQAHETLSNLDSLARSLDGLVGTIRRDPSIVVRGATTPVRGPGE